ncbi:VOC family protein [Pedobacter rhodius]|uniref:VOC family protein n=1 Tax=Pedobacter rhodius TaxID=3004098 RepID=A0ABT4KXG1_9SPHI|nr:VOC family protein [Pedobacter sp. SJ11]MCZ4223617.1 VOC family protein [Pedobacter sp. SJ11]
MKKQILSLSIILLFAGNVLSQNKLNPKKNYIMKLNAGIITSKIAESKVFYTSLLNFGVTFENEFYLLLHTPDKSSEISFLLPNHPTQQPFFHKPFKGEGMYLTLEVDDVDKIYKIMKKKKVEIKIDIRNEPWGDRHFAIEDPNGVGIDIVTYAPVEEK